MNLTHPMRAAPFLFASLYLLFLATGPSFSQDQEKLAKRYGIDANPTFYPQKTPQETLASACKAIESRRIEFLLAQLADPRFVDETVNDYKNTLRRGSEQDKTYVAFDRLVQETSRYFLQDPTLLQELRRFAKDAEWETAENQAAGSVKDIQGRKVFLRKYEGRWFLENRQQ
jgi:hypothetical protein